MSPWAYARGGVTLVRIQNSLETVVVVLCLSESLTGYPGGSLSVFSINGYILSCMVSFIYSKVRGVLGNLSTESGRGGGERQAVLPGLVVLDAIFALSPPNEEIMHRMLDQGLSLGDLARLRIRTEHSYREMCSHGGAGTGLLFRCCIHDTPRQHIVSDCNTNVCLRFCVQVMIICF
jgi:hypothetical protein